MPPSRHEHILIVDDQTPMREILASILSAEGFKNLHFAADGRSALQTLNADPGAYSMVLLDWNMPVMDGLEVLEAMRATPELAEMPVIMVTAEAESEQVMKALLSGLTDYVVKPYSPATIYKKIGKLLGIDI